MRSKVAQKIQDEISEEVHLFVRHYTDVVVRINQLMEKQGLNQRSRELRTGKKPSEINKWIKGNINLTLKTIAKLEAELGAPIIYTRKAS